MTSKDWNKQLTLGKSICYIDHYDSDLLQNIPRYLNRKKIGLNAENIPFNGEDIWTLYELSWLNSKGLPQIATCRVIVDANSKNIIESKSFKLYLNSFNQTIFSNWHAVYHTLQKDLEICAMGKIKLTIFHLNDVKHESIEYFKGNILDEQDIFINNYVLNANYLKNATSNKIVKETLVSNLLKTNCLITHQPDWGSVMIRYKGPCINRESLLRYLISFRQHNEFHEQCVERIFNDIWYFCHPEELTVYARYTRRGGIDINPWRSNVPFSPCYSRLARQ